MQSPFRVQVGGWGVTARPESAKMVDPSFEVPDGNEFRPEVLADGDVDEDGQEREEWFAKAHPLHEAHVNGKPVPRKAA